MADDLAPSHDALQQSVGPRPLPLFLELVRRAGEHDQQRAKAALQGLGKYQNAARHAAQQSCSIVAEAGRASLRCSGGRGYPIILVPSLINPPHILDLDAASSLAKALTPAGRVLLLDWGPVGERRSLDVAGHVTGLLLPLLEGLDRAPVLIGYCLGGTMALAAAALRPVRAVATLAAPWRFSAYPPEAREALFSLWAQSRGAAEHLGVLPIEVLQAAFWSLDPDRVVAKFAKLADLDPSSEEFRRFVALEDWANTGEPLPFPAARELIEDLFGSDVTGANRWIGSGLPSCPALHVTAAADRIAPAATAAPGDRLALAAGHVGMVVGRSAPAQLHLPLRQWLEALDPDG